MPLDFAKSARSTIGIEWELQLIDKDSNDLRQAAEHIINECGGHPHIHAEMLLNTVEVTSGVHTNVSGCVEDLIEAVGVVRAHTENLRSASRIPSATRSWSTAPSTGVAKCSSTARMFT